MIIRDFESLLNYAENDSFSDNSSVGTVGYCMSGPFVFRLAAEFSRFDQMYSINTRCFIVY